MDSADAPGNPTTLNARPAVYTVWLVVTLLTVPMFTMSAGELAPTEDQSVIFLDASANSTLDQNSRYAAAVNQVFLSVSSRRPAESWTHSWLASYTAARNDPSKHGQSGLSPYLHFGHISAQGVALEIIERHDDKASRDAFLEELIVRRELADNFCFFNPGYDSLDGFPRWAGPRIPCRRPTLLSRSPSLIQGSAAWSSNRGTIANMLITRDHSKDREREAAITAETVTSG